MGARARSGDPRARDFLRTTVQREDLPDDVMAQVIRSLGQDYSTAQDASLLRNVHPKLRAERAKMALISAVGDFGGTANINSLIVLAPTATTNQSRPSTP